MEIAVFIEKQIQKIKDFEDIREDKKSLKKKGTVRSYVPRKTTFEKLEKGSALQFYCLKYVHPFGSPGSSPFTKYFIELLEMSWEQINRMKQETKERVIQSCLIGAKKTLFTERKEVFSYQEVWFGSNALLEKEYKAKRLECLMGKKDNIDKYYLIPESEYKELETLILGCYEDALRYVLCMTEEDYGEVERNIQIRIAKQIIKKPYGKALQERYIRVLWGLCKEELEMNNSLLEATKKEYKSYPTSVFSLIGKTKIVERESELITILRYIEQIYETMNGNEGNDFLRLLDEKITHIFNKKNNADVNRIKWFQETKKLKELSK